MLKKERMTGACTIDGTDIATLGGLILRGGDHGLITFPTRKEPVMIEWPDEDGFEISDDDPVFDGKKLTVQYYFKGDETNLQSRLLAFVSLHFLAGYRSVYIREFDLTFQLRFAGVSYFNMKRGFSVTGEKSARISIDYVMDNPVHFFNTGIVAPTAFRAEQTYVEIAGYDLADFGIVVNEIYSGAFKSSAKKTLIYNSKYAIGLTVDTSYAPKKEKQQITAKCTMICADRAEFMTNWNALWNTIAVSSLTLDLTSAGKTFTAFYLSMSSFKKRPWTNRAIAEFELNFTGFEV